MALMKSRHKNNYSGYIRFKSKNIHDKYNLVLPEKTATGLIILTFFHLFIAVIVKKWLLKLLSQ